MTSEADSSFGTGAGAVRRGRRTIVAALSAVAVVTLAACSGGGSGGTGTAGSPSSTEGEPQKGGTLNMLGVGDVDYMDPNVSYYSGGYLAHRLYSRQPYTYSGEADKAGETVPDLATDLPKVSDDGLNATITIREGAKWDTSPARQITAEDLIRGIKRTCNPAQPFGGLPDYQDLIVGFSQFCEGFAKVGQTADAIAAYQNGNEISGLKVGSDERTLEMTLTHPASYLADMMTLTAFSPAPKEYDAYVPGSAELAQHTVACGPYKITAYEPTKSISFDRNPAWDGSTDPVRKAYVDKVEVNETGQQESIQQQLQTGTPSADMEWDTFPPPAQVPGLVAANDPKLNLGETSSSNPYVILNTVSPNNGGALGKVEVRQALMYGINRDNIIQALGGPKTNPPLTHILPPSILGGEEDFDPYPYDVAKAKQLLAQAGFPNGMTLKFLYRNQSQGSSKAFATIQQDLKAVGITVQGVPSPNADFYTKYLQVPSVAQRGVWDLSLAGWGADWHGNSAISYFNPLFSGKPSFPPIGSNFGFYDSASTNQLIKAAIDAKTEDEAKAGWAKADKAVMDDAVIFPITNVVQANYHAEQVKNAVFIDQLQNFDPANVWLDPAKNG
jgi:peptide/nickel transport system substrate-binding protein